MGISTFLLSLILPLPLIWSWEKEMRSEEKGTESTLQSRNRKRKTVEKKLNICKVNEQLNENESIFLRWGVKALNKQFTGIIIMSRQKIRFSRVSL